MTPGEVARDRLFAVTEDLRASVADVIAQPAHRFRWADAELWIDRERLLVLSAYYADVIGIVDQRSAPEELLNLEGPARSSTPITTLMDFLGGLAVGVEPAQRDEVSCAEWINLAVIEATLDPAAKWLCWLVLDYGCRPHLERSLTIAEVAAPLMADLALLPGDRDPVEARRAAQVAFVREKFVPNLESRWESVPSEAWAERCAEVARDAKFVFDDIAYRGKRRRQYSR